MYGRYHSLEENSVSKNISTALPTNKDLTGLLVTTSPRRTLSPSSARIPRNPSAVSPDALGTDSLMGKGFVLCCKND